MKTRIIALLLCLLLLLTGCGKKDKNEGYQNPEEQGTTADLGDDNKSFGESLDDLGAYDGYFEGESTDIVVECISGTQGAYKLEGTTLTFTGGGTITAYSNDDGLHADGTLSVNAGTVSVTNSYEGVEGANVNISDGYVSVNAKDDGVNATTTTGTAVSISGGTLYIYCSGDGIDSNSRTSYQGIVFSGGNTVVISNSNGNR